RLESLGLQSVKLRYPGRREIQQGVELVSAEGVTLCRTLHFHEPTAVVHHDVHVSFGVRVFGVVEIQHGGTVVDTHRYRCDLAVQRAGSNGLTSDQLVTGLRQGDEPTRDGCSACTAVCLEHV